VNFWQKTERKKRSTVLNPFLRFFLLTFFFLSACGIYKVERVRFLWLYGEDGRILSSGSGGGWVKEVALLQELRAEEDIQATLEGGNFLPPDLVMAKQSAELFRRGFDSAGVDVCAIGPQEVLTSAHILKFLSESKCTALGTYIESPTLPRIYKKEISKGLVLGVATAIPRSISSLGDVILNPQQLEEAMKTLKTQSNLLVLLVHESRLKDVMKWLSQYPEVDLVLGSIPDLREENTPVATKSYGKTHILSWGAKQIGVAELGMEIRTGTITQLQVKWHPVEATQKDAESLLPLLEEYMKQREILGLSRAWEPRDYSGAVSCRRCHEKIYEVWIASPHARAFHLLIPTRDEYNPECLTCHTLGFGKPGGFQNIRDTPTFINVQCEACHSPALQHTFNPSVKVSVPRRTQCRQCHTPQWSPDFEQVIHRVDAHSLKGK